MLANEDVLRTMMSHLIQTMEADLSDYLNSLGVDVHAEVRNFLIARSKTDKKTKFEDPISQVYWLDLWELALDLETDDKRKNMLKRLLKYASDETIRLARNSHGHGNQSFFKHYWYALAHLANRPEVKFLEFRRVQEAIKRIESGDFLGEVVLDDSENYQIEVSNNLPQPDWKKTGYIGRSQDIRKLEQELKFGRANAICISGPGGVGKTALALKVLENLSFENIFQQIYYFSLKSEFLTTGGISQSNVQMTINNLDEDFAHFLASRDLELNQIESACICIDNIEDITVGDDTAFNSWIDSLPSSWKIFVTSRLMPNGFKIIKVEELDNNGCLNLGRKYVQLFGSNDAVLGFETHKDTVIETCAKNPLAIKLAIDLGRDDLNFSKSASTAMGMVTDFSFKNLSEHFDEDTVKIMEVLRQTGASEISSISEILSMPLETCIDKLNRIRRTSLIVTKPDPENDTLLYENTDLTSNFLSSTDEIGDIREEISKKIKNKRGTKTKINDFNERLFGSNGAFCVPEEAPGETLKLIEQLRSYGLFLRHPRSKRTLANRNGLSEIQKKWNELPVTFKSSSYFYRIRAEIFSWLNDARALENYEKGLDLERSEASILVFANHHFRNEEYETACNIYSRGLKDFPESLTLGIGYCVNLTFTNVEENRHKALEFSFAKLEAGENKYTNSFLNAWCRLAENGLANVSDALIDKGLKLFIEKADDLLEINLFERFIDNLTLLLWRYHETFVERVDCQLVLEALEKYQSLGGKFAPITARTGNELNPYMKTLFERIGYEDRLDGFLENELAQSTHITDDSSLHKRMETGELIIAKVTSVKAEKGFCFARCMQGEDFFCHFSYMMKEFDGAESLISVGDVLALKIEQGSSQGVNKRSSEFYVVPRKWASKLTSSV